MLSDYNYLRKTVLNSTHTSKYSCDLSFLSDEIKAQLTKKFVPITHPDLMPGNFIVGLEINRLTFYNVVSVLEANSGVCIAHEDKYIDVLYMYGAQKNLQCKCPYLYQDFLYKISRTDIGNIIESINPTTEKNGTSDNLYQDFLYKISRSDIGNIIESINPTTEENGTSDTIKRQVSFPNLILPISGDQFNVRTPYQEAPERQNTMKTRISNQEIKRLPSILKKTPSQEDVRQSNPALPKKQTSWLIKILTCCMVE